MVSRADPDEGGDEGDGQGAAKEERAGEIV
jgi:hypothetical protein